MPLDLQVWVSGSQVLLSSDLEHMSLDINCLPSQRDGTLLIWLHQDAQCVQSKLKLWTYTNED